MLVGCSGGPSSTVIAMLDSSSNRKEMVKLRWHLEKKKIEKLLLYKDISYKMYELLDNKDRKVDLKEGKKEVQDCFSGQIGISRDS